MKRFALVVIALAVAVPAAATPFNVAAGATVTATGALGVVGPTPPPYAVPGAPLAALASLVDGVLLTEGTGWQDGTVWWDESNPGSANNILEIDFGGTFLITFLRLQADNNDAYGMEYRNAEGVWTGYGQFPAVAGPGMRLREGIGSTFIASAMRLDAHPGDGLYSISEFQAIGTPVPEPASLILLGTGLAVAARRYRRRTR